MAKPDKLLERMRASKSGWKRKELDRLYEGFGFIIRKGRKHDIVVHPKYPQLRATITRSSKLAEGYIQKAVSLVDQLKELEASDHG